MSDIFSSISIDLKPSDSKNDSKDKTATAHSSDTVDTLNPSTHQKVVKEGKSTSSKSELSKVSKSSKRESSKPTKSDENDKKFDQLAEIIASGFRDLKDMLAPTDDLDEFDEHNHDVFPEFPEESEDLFDELSENISTKDTVGKEVRSSLASLCDRLLQLKITDSTLKEKQELHLRPKNISSLQVPQVNKPVWDTLSQSTRIKESKFQQVQKDMLSSAVPIIKVMDTIADAKDDLSALDAKELVNSLKDSLIFLGSSNMNLIKIRKEGMKLDLPKRMHGLCSDLTEISCEFLFGDNLNAAIKEVSEINKISDTMKRRQNFTRSFGRGSTRARGRPFRRFPSKGATRRYAPYVARRNESRSSNQAGPSRK